MMRTTAQRVEVIVQRVNDYIHIAIVRVGKDSYSPDFIYQIDGRYATADGLQGYGETSREPKNKSLSN